MKFVTAKDVNGIFVGLLDETEENVLPLSLAEQKLFGTNNCPESLVSGISSGARFIDYVQTVLNAAPEDLYIPLHSVELLAPIPRPSKNIFCVGKNYVDHALELGGSKDDIPEDILVFTKAPTTVTGHGKMVPLHSEVTDSLDYEGELAIVIGKQGKGIKKEEALDHIFGYTIINDITARDLQFKHKQYFIGKSLDESCPIGPCIVQASAVANPNQLDIVTKVNGEVRQSSNTEHFIFSVETIISELSKGMTLEPGDIISTGTPAGVGSGYKPPRFLQAGDKVEITIEGIGTLENTIGE
ncbi:fumarylacetoacetate hydrolase family protein [Mesobacillus maritimus]|uniref:Fumarylacetoacetate hydrolase family protein n=1 Tax=Mesobacillus maritimus TaxID=1643336 RepID=A0ABS7JZF0_9BACI|nr:fumarylacetoacetate hydrolase family protein [Mesobacillus maritimus]MBY0095296.1 fumarylacetoacetate hydrolase family protein [Mesobacillus maritimus]